MPDIKLYKRQFSQPCNMRVLLVLAVALALCAEGTANSYCTALSPEVTVVCDGTPSCCVSKGYYYESNTNRDCMCNKVFWWTTNCHKCSSCHQCETFTPCPNGCLSNEYNANCGGFSEGRCTACESCPQDYYRLGCGGQSSGQCTPCEGCPSDQYRYGCGGSSPGYCVACALCYAGTYLSGCGLGSLTGTRTGYCALCGDLKPGKYFSSVCLQSDCLTCGVGQYLINCGGTSMGQCVSCGSPDSGKYYSSACTQTECTNKPAFSSYSGNGGTSNNCPWVCDLGYYQSGGACAQCTNKPSNSIYTGNGGTGNNCPWVCLWNYHPNSGNTGCTRNLVAVPIICIRVGYSGDPSCPFCAVGYYSPDNGTTIPCTQVVDCSAGPM